MPSNRDPEIKQLYQLIAEDKLDVNLSAKQVIDQVPLLKLRCLSDPNYSNNFPKYWSRLASTTKKNGELGRRFGGEPTPPNPEDFPPAPKPATFPPTHLLPPTPLRSPANPSSGKTVTSSKKSVTSSKKSVTSSQKYPLSLSLSPESQGSLASSDDDDSSVKSNNQKDILDDWENYSYSDHEDPLMASVDTSIGDLVKKMSKASVNASKPGGYTLSMRKIDWSNQKLEQRCTYMIRLPSGVGIDDTSAKIIPANGKGNPLILIEWNKCDAMTDANIFWDRYERREIVGITTANEADLLSFLECYKTQTIKTTQSQMVSSTDF
jgi:hypothetical protein